MVSDLNLEHFVHIFVQIRFAEDAVALTVDTRSLGIQHIIVLQHMFTAIKIGTLYTILGALDDLADKAHFHRHGIIHLHTLHHAIHLLAAKQAH